MRQRGLSFKEALNFAIPRGSHAHRDGPAAICACTFALGAGRNFRWDQVLAAADAIEDEELKLSLGK